jgi:hypothetical protein
LINGTSWKPKRDYLTFDIEIVRHLCNEKIGKSTTINDEIELLSIDYASHNEIKHFDRRES